MSYLITVGTLSPADQKLLAEAEAKQKKKCIVQ